MVAAGAQPPIKENRKKPKKFGGCDSRHTPRPRGGAKTRVIERSHPLKTPGETQMAKINTIALVPALLAITLVAQTAAALLIIG
jgi:hypothetical protein